MEGKTSCQNRGPTWETFFDVFSIGGNSVHFRSNDTFRISPSFCTTTVIDVILSVCAREKKRERPRNRIHLPRGLLIVFHSTINPSNPLESTASRISSLFSSLQLLHTFPVTLQIHQPPPARRRVTLQKRCIPRNVALKRETPELIPSMALKLSFLLLNSREV